MESHSLRVLKFRKGTDKNNANKDISSTSLYKSTII